MNASDNRPLRGYKGQVYDLAADVAETRDLASAKPEVARRLAGVLGAWDKELVAPVFLASSVKNEDWGPGGANERARVNQAPKQGKAAAAKPKANP